MYVNKYKEYPNSCIVLYLPEKENIFEGNEDAILTSLDETIDGNSVLENERENVLAREGQDPNDPDSLTEEEQNREDILNSLTPEQREIIEEVQDAFRDPDTDSSTLQNLMSDFVFNGPLYQTGYDIYERSILEGR
tara:strand:+ start:2180 stop:2587 length:408 start_codon:yes stop_codon:yes gene_type:complete